MTREDIKQIRWYKKEIAMLDEKIRELREQSLTGGAIGDGMPKTKSTSSMAERIAIQIYELSTNLYEKKNKLLKLVTESINFIYTIEDSQLRMIVKYRALDGMSWSEMADIMGLDRTSLSKKYEAFLNTLE